MKPLATVTLLVLSAANASAIAAEPVLLVNGTITDITFDYSGHVQDLLPGSKLEVPVSQLNSLRFGQEQLEYGARVARALGGQKQAALQAQPDGCLYLVPRTLIQPMKRPPKQPAGFPICPSRRIDLT